MFKIKLGETSSEAWFYLMDSFHLICVARAAQQGASGSPTQSFRAGLRQAINSAVYPNTPCPYRQLYSESHSKYIYLDLPDRYTLTSSLVFYSTQDIELEVSEL